MPASPHRARASADPGKATQQRNARNRARTATNTKTGTEAHATRTYDAISDISAHACTHAMALMQRMQARSRTMAVNGERRKHMHGSQATAADTSNIDLRMHADC